jgi:uncharacterized protein YcbX
MMPTVARLSIAPVKALALEEPEQVRLEPFGVVGNRVFHLVDADGDRVSGPKHGRLMQVRASYDVESERLSLAFPDGSSVEGDGARLDGSVVSDFWGRSVAARVVDGPFGPALSEWYGSPLRLVRSARPGDAADVEPLSLMSTASAEALSRWAGDDPRVLDTRRFRLNIELAGCEPFEEDTWEGRAMRIGDAVIRVGGPIPRCAITTYDPDSGVRDFGTLKAIREVRGVTPQGKLNFGVYASVVEPGVIAVGDEALLAG